MRSFTLALDEWTLRAARRIAAERSTTLDALVGEFREESIQRESRPVGARRRSVELWRESRAEVGPREWTRNDPHER